MRVPRTKPPLWARLFVVFGALLMVGSGLLIISGKVLIAAANHGVNQENLLGPEGAKERAHATVTGPKTVLLVGLDSRPGQNPNDLVRADSIMLLHVSASHDRAYLVSIPRDTYAQIPPDPKTGYAGGTEKINAAFAYGNWHGGGIAGGVQLLAKTIEQMTGIGVPDAAAVITFSGFQQVVGALGGVDMCIDEKTTSIHIGYTADGKERPPFRINTDGTVGSRIRGVTPVVYEPGCRHLAAWQALDYVRQRDLLANHDLDYGRQRHQQQFIKAIFKKIFTAGTLTNIGKLNSVMNAMRGAMTIDAGNIQPSDWAYAMRNITPDSVVTVKTNGGQLNPKVINGIDYEALSDTSMQLLQAVKSDTVDAFLLQHPDWASKS